MQQINVLYGSDVEIVQSYLAAAATVGRPGGNPLRTALGLGGLFNESSGVSIVLIDGRVATTVIAPSEELALSIVSSLSGLTQ